MIKYFAFLWEHRYFVCVDSCYKFRILKRKTWKYVNGQYEGSYGNKLEEESILNYNLICIVSYSITK